ncbi:hypothetical protein J3R82DRAFT_1823 [Butyriboletus roseoflavus]|nr:hypothetical protein J3R82DRAFT_1823 [Butyriboletus roseoflavus]
MFTSPVVSKAREDKAFDPLGDVISKILAEVQGCYGNGRHHVKDSWRDATRQSKSKILEDILVSVQEKLSAGEIAKAEEHFVRVWLWEDVTKIDNDLDGTLDPTAGEGGSWTWGWQSITSLSSEKKYLSSTDNIPDADRLLSAFLLTPVVGPTQSAVFLSGRLSRISPLWPTS